MKNYFVIASMLLLAFVLSSACGDSSSPTSVSSPTTTVPPTTGGVIADPSFSNDIQPIFNQNGCTNGGCHGVAMAASLDLQPGASHANLVNFTATREPLLRVIPGNADGSYLVGRSSVGG